MCVWSWGRVCGLDEGLILVKFKKIHVALAMAGSLLMPNMALTASLPDAMAAAYANSKLLESARAALRAQDEDVPGALAAMRPQLSALARVSGRTRRAPPGGNMKRPRATDSSLPATLQLIAEIQVYDGGDTDLTVQAAQESIRAARQSLVEAEQQVLLAAAQAYHDVLRQRELLEVAENGLILTKTQLQAAQSRFELGEITRTDVSLVEASLATAQGRVFMREGDLEIAERNYELAVGTLPGALDPTPPLPELPADLEHAQSVAAQVHPAIKRAKHALSAARLTLRRSETAKRPRISVGSSVGTNRDLQHWSHGIDTMEIFVETRIPLYQGGTTSSLLRRAVANAERAAVELQREAQLVALDVSIAHSRLEVAASLIPTNEQHVDSAELAYQGIRQETALGARTTIDLLNAEQDLQEARSNLVAALKERDMAVYALLESVGLLTVQHLGLGVPEYDAKENFNRVKNAPDVQNRQEIVDRILEKTR